MDEDSELALLEIELLLLDRELEELELDRELELEELELL